MKNWETLEADITMILGTHYTPGRGGRSIDKIIIHHNAGNLTTKGCYDVWQSREASAHYQVEASGTIGQLVWDKDTAWHAGNWDANASSIGIEHADISNSPWSVSDATLDNGAHLVAALCHHYKLGRPQWYGNVFPHHAFSPTECPASLDGSQRDAYMLRAQQYYDQMEGKEMPLNQNDLNNVTNAVLQYKNPRMNGNKDVYQLLTDINKALADNGHDIWSYKNPPLNGDADTYRLLTNTAADLTELKELIKANTAAIASLAAALNGKTTEQEGKA